MSARANRSLVFATGVAVCSVASPAAAAPTEAEAPRGRWRPGQSEFMRAHAPTAGMVDLGAYAGLWFPSPNHELYDGRAGFTPLRPAAGDFGVRVGYYPLSWLVFEAESGGGPARTDDRAWVGLWHARGHLLAQLPWRVAPFALAGVGIVGVASAQDELGDDLDPAWYFGGGAKIYICGLVSLRLELRDNLSNRSFVGGGPAHHVELLGGIAFSFGRERVQRSRGMTSLPASADRDGDGIDDGIDECPARPGLLPDGCPRSDRDRDGYIDRIDTCPEMPGDYPDGCPSEDIDKDGVPDMRDRCPARPGAPPDGCAPIQPETASATDGHDGDADGVSDATDQCPTQPEARNGYADDDGCPDQLPKDLERIDGVIDGVVFEADTARLSPESMAPLDAIAGVLSKYPSVRLEIVAHTDSEGSPEHNRDLSQRRAQAVHDYLVKAGIAPSRLQPRGAASDEPIASNATPQGRAQNRRIETRLVTD